MSFKKASKKQQKARVALIGPAGSGKTFTALTVAKNLGDRVAVIDTERGSASKYAGDVADFDTCDLDQHSPTAYVRQIRDAAAAGYDVLVIDSLSHAWEGEGGILDQVDKKGGRFDAWRDMAPQTRELIDAILTYPGHVIATMRTKTEYVVEQVQKNGRTVSEPRKVGLAPKFKEGLEYEFDVVGTLDEDNVLRVSKSRAPSLSGQSIAKPGKQFAQALRSWLDDGEAAAPKAAPVHFVNFFVNVDAAVAAFVNASTPADYQSARAAAAPIYRDASPEGQERITEASKAALKRIKASAAADAKEGAA